MHNPNYSKYSIAIGGVLALAVSIGFGRFVYTPILPFMISSGVVNESLAGAIATMNYVGYLIGAFAVARFGRFGRIRDWFLLALAINACMTVAMGFFENAIMLGLIRFAGGVSSAYAFVLVATLVVNRLARIGESHLYGLQFAGVGTGIALSAILVAILADTGSDWQSLWIYSGLVSIFGTVLIVFLISPDTGSVSSKNSSEPPVKFNWTLIRLIVAYGFFGVGYVITATFISTIVHQEPTLQLLEPYVWMLVGFSAIPSAAIFSRIAIRYGNRISFTVGCLLEALAVFISGLSTNSTLVAISAMLFGGTFVGITAVGLREAGLQASENLRQVIGYMTASFGVGQIIGPITAGQMFAFFGSFKQAAILASILLIAASILTAWPSRQTQTC